MTGDNWKPPSPSGSAAPGEALADIELFREDMARRKQQSEKLSVEDELVAELRRKFGIAKIHALRVIRERTANGRRLTAEDSRAICRRFARLRRTRGT